MKLTYKHTMFACYSALVVQAVINNLPALLFVTFRESFGFSLEQLGLLVSINFCVQMLVDVLAAGYTDKVGYRRAMLISQAVSAAGLVFVAAAPYLPVSPFAGLAAATVMMAVGSGLMEVIVSPLIHSLPTSGKHSSMSLLHSFYCWGHLGVVILSTMYFCVFGRSTWQALTAAWAMLPAAVFTLFTSVPICRPQSEENPILHIRSLFSQKKFIVFVCVMICAGASEQAMAQWSSLFAETGLHVSKTTGDLLGPGLFALMMGSSRLFFGIHADKLDMRRVLTASSLLCIAGYLTCVASPVPILSLIGCGICGLAVGVLWPGTISLAASVFPLGGTAMFGILALGGDIGCAAGPGLVGLISGTIEKLTITHGAANGVQYGLKCGMLAAAIFPASLFLCLMRRRVKQRRRQP